MEKISKKEMNKKIAILLKEECERLLKENKKYYTLNETKDIRNNVKTVIANLQMETSQLILSSKNNSAISKDTIAIYIDLLDKTKDIAWSLLVSSDTMSSSTLKNIVALANDILDIK